MTFEVASCSVSSPQKTAGFCVRMKKNGRRGKKKPMRTPWRKLEELDELELESVAEPALSMESIHCSSRARVCSSSVGRKEGEGLVGCLCLGGDESKRGYGHSSSVAKSTSR